MTLPEMSVIFVHLETGRKIRGYTVEQMMAWGKACAAAEREACAKVCEDLGMATNGMYERNATCAAAIRARGNT